MALYGGARDISMFRYVNRELIHNIISQECVLYKFNLNETPSNIYGEASKQKYYNRPILLYCLIETPNQDSPVSELGINFSWKPTFRFLADDLYSASIESPMYQNGYFEVDHVNGTQFFVGKDPAYPFDDSLGNNYPASPLNINPLPETDLSQFGYNVSVICETHYVPADMVQIILERF